MLLRIKIQIWMKYLDRVIRGEANHPTALPDGEVAQPVGGLTVVGVLLGVIYGLCMGCFGLFRQGTGAVPQLFSTMVKVPALFFLTLAVTFPSLYVFNALVGSRMSLVSVVRLLVISLAVMVTVLASLGPIVAFFSASTTSYPFMVLLNVVIFGTAGILGLGYLRTTLNRLSEAQSASSDVVTAPVPQVMSQQNAGEAVISPVVAIPVPPVIPGTEPPIPINTVAQQKDHKGDRKEVRVVFRIWMVVFGIVGGQMAWVLRPFLGRPNSPFMFLRGRESSFFVGVLHAITSLLR